MGLCAVMTPHLSEPTTHQAGPLNISACRVAPACLYGQGPQSREAHRNEGATGMLAHAHFTTDATPKGACLSRQNKGP